MEAPASRRTVAPPVTAPRGRFPPQSRRAYLPWIAPAALLHLALVLLLISNPRTPQQRVRPLPAWAIALATPQADEPVYEELPGARVPDALEPDAAPPRTRELEQPAPT